MFIEAGRRKALRFGLIGGVIVAVIIALGVGGYRLWQERAAEQTRAEKLAADKQKLEEKARLAEEREATLRKQLELARNGIKPELADGEAMSGASEPLPFPRVLPASAIDYAKMLLLEGVPKAEEERRRAIRTRLEEEDTIAADRLGTMQAQKIFAAAGIALANALAAATRIEHAVLFPSSPNELQAALLAIDGMPKLVQGDRNAARRANSEGLELMKAKRFEDAAAAFNRAFSHDPADAEVLRNLSYAYLKNGQLAETLRISSYVIRLYPRSAAVWYHVAIAHAQRGTDWLAVRAFVVLYTLSSNQANTRSLLNRVSVDDADERVREAAKHALLVLPEPPPR
jgi:tetratricopeptide (TPR) repeat protein